MPRYDVFLSHANADKPAVEHLAHKLREEGLEPFLDKWHLIPGERWISGMNEALAQSSTLAVFIGPKSGGGAWRTREVESSLARAARESSFRVIPVLLPGGDGRAVEELSGFLEILAWVDFRAGLDDEDAFRRLLAGIRGKAPGPGGGGEKPSLPYRCMAPAREPFVQRSEYTKVRDALLANGTDRATTVGITTAIHGAGGFGKTALATEICYDPRIQERYPDGVLWTTMGEDVNDAGRLARILNLIRWWTESNPPAFQEDSREAASYLREKLTGKRVLLVVDDVWAPEDISPFLGLGPGAALLATTREGWNLPTETLQVRVDAMDIPDAVQLLSKGLSASYGAFRILAARLGEWPLLLKIVNRQVLELVRKDGLAVEQALQEINEALDAEGLTVFDREDVTARNQAVARTLQASLRRLAPEEVEQFAMLAIFPEDKDIPLSILGRLWSLEAFQVKKLCGHLHDLSLLLRFDRTAGTIRLHDVIRAYLFKKEESRLADWNRTLLGACCPTSGCWSDLPVGESYLWKHLIHHLIGGEELELCRELLLDIRFLSSKLMAADLNALMADYSPFVDQDSDLRLVQDALRLSAPALIRDPAQLREQLWGRLLDRQEAGIRDLLKGGENPDVSWVRPRKASLTRPGGVRVRTIDCSGSPNALVVLPGGQVVSGSDQGMLQVWDMESGEALQSFEGDSKGVRAVAALDSQCVVSGSSDGTLRVWDVGTGQILQSLKGHALGVRTVAVLNSRRVVSGSYDGTLRVWDVESGQALQVIKGKLNWILVVAALDGRLVVSGSDDGKLRVWDVESGQSLKVLEGHSNWVTAVAVLDSNRVVSGSDDGTLRVWDVESGQTLQVLEGHSHWVRAVAVLDSRRVVSGSSDGTLRVWDLESGQTLQVLEGHSDEVLAVGVLGSRWIISSSSDGTLQVWDVEGGQDHQVLERHSDLVTSVAVLNSRRAVSASEDGTLWVWDLESGHPLQVLEGHSDLVNAVAVLDSRRVVSGSEDGTIWVWDVESGQDLQVLEGGSAERFRAVDVLDNYRLVSGSADGVLQLWGIKSGQVLQARYSDGVWDAESEDPFLLAEHPAGINALMALDRHRVVVSGSEDGTLWVWDVRRDDLEVFAEFHERINALAALKGRLLVCGAESGAVWVLNAKRGGVIQVLERHRDRINAVAVLDSRRVVSGSDDQTLRVWNIESGETLCAFMLDAPVTALAVVQNDRIIIAGDATGRVHFFDFVEP